MLESQRGTAPIETWVFHTYVDRDGQWWRWRLQAPDGRVMAESGQGYDTPEQVRRAIRDVRWNAVSAGVD